MHEKYKTNSLEKYGMKQIYLRFKFVIVVNLLVVGL